jgi:hypothetical protein
MLPHFNSIKEPNFTDSVNKLIEPIFTNLFKVNFHSDNLFSKDLLFLNESLIKITDRNLYFNVNQFGNDIYPFYQLEVLKNKKINFDLILHDKKDTILAKFLIKDCKIAYSYKQILNFAWESDDILKPFEVNYTFDDIEYIPIENTPVKN